MGNFQVCLMQELADRAKVTATYQATMNAAMQAYIAAIGKPNQLEAQQTYIAAISTAADAERAGYLKASQAMMTCQADG